MAAYVVVDLERADLQRAVGHSERSGPSAERPGARLLARRGPISILDPGMWQMVVVDGV